jgi:pimeloyl-ACP methyl ester carboxylesterase
VAAAAFIGPALPIGEPHPERAALRSFDEELDTDEGWAKYNRPYWLRDYRGFLEFFFAQCFTEAHSTKQIEDCVGWGLETDPETLALTHVAPGLATREETLALCARVRCPVLVLHGEQDAIRPLAHGAALAKATGGQLVVLEGSGHIPLARDPVKVNLLLREFVESLP